MTVTEKDERKALMEQLVSEEVMRPMDYFPHYVNASSDPKLQRLRDDHGWESVGRWWFLVELLHAAEGHAIDVSRPAQWRRLSNELEFDDVTQCRDFIAWLSALRLIDKDALEGGHVINKRVVENAEFYAKKRAAGRIGKR